MKKVSFKNLSLLGLVLLGASAVTSAFTPAKDKGESKTLGHLTFAEDSMDWTCTNLAGDSCSSTVFESTADDENTQPVDTESFS